MAFAFNTPAQDIKKTDKTFTFQPGIKRYITVPALNINIPPLFLQEQLPFINPIKTGVCYHAFFCKMEVENLKRFNVWIKFHAADYDTYTVPNRND